MNGDRVLVLGVRGKEQHAMPITHLPDGKRDTATAIASDTEALVMFRARHLVRLVARSWMMSHDLEHRDLVLLPEHLSRIIDITGEAGLSEIERKARLLLDALPDLGQVDIYQGITRLHGDILDVYHAYRRLPGVSAYH